ncbi:MAG: hypothetical protein C1943_14825 [Halochromatium sp.]|nr:hypothetical protein [Halochromatium sp.]
MTSFRQPRRHRLLAIAFATAFISSGLRAESLSLMLARTYQSNPDIQTALAQVRATAELLPQANSAFFPTIDLVAQEGRSWIRQDVRDRGQAGTTINDLDEVTTDRSVQLEASIYLYQGGARSANQRSAESQVASAVAQLDATVAQTLLQAIQAYGSLLLYHELIALNADIERFLVKLMVESEDLFSSRLITLTDLAQTKASLAQTRSQKAALQGSLAQALSQYRAVSGMVPEQIEQGGTELPALPATLQAIQVKARTANPSLRSALLSAEAARAEIDVERGGLLPNVVAYSQLTRSWDKSRFTSAADYTELEREDDWSVGVQLEIPLFQGGLVRSQVREAEAVYTAAKSQARSTSVQLASAIETTWGQWQSALAEQLSVADEVAAYQETLQGFERQLRDGTSTIKDVLDVRTQLDSALENQVMVKYDRYIAQASLLALMGQLSPKALDLPVSTLNVWADIDQVRHKLFEISLP